MIATYRDERGRETIIEPISIGSFVGWAVKYYETARCSEVPGGPLVRVQGWTIAHRADTWREAAGWANAFRGTRIPMDGAR